MKLSQDKVKVTMKFWHGIIAKDDPSPDSVLTDQGMVLQHWSRCSEANLGAGNRAHPWPQHGSHEAGPGFIQGVPSGAARAGPEDTAAA